MSNQPSLSKPWSQQKSSSRSSPKSGQGEHEKLREYESRRRLAYASKYDSMALYWKSYRDLLSASLHETGRVQRLVLGTSRAHQLYSNAMQAMSDDVFLDEKGNVTNEKAQKKLAYIRKKPVKIFPKKGSASEVKDISLQKEIRHSHRVMAEKFGDNAKNMDKEIAQAIGSLLEDLKVMFNNMETLGSSILEELEKTEEEVTEAWEAYLSKASSVFSSTTVSPSSSQETASKSGATNDTWVVNMQYRIAVAYQNSAWEKGSLALTNLFTKVKQEECVRRTTLREFLVAFVQRQQRLFLSIPSIQSSVLESLVEKEMTKEEMESIINAAIEELALKYKKESGGKAVASKSAAHGTDNKGLYDHLESPLSSDLICKAKIVERKGSGVVSAWKKTLAVMTADSYLHLYDLENVHPGTSPEEAFKTVMPSIFEPCSIDVEQGKSNFSRGWSDSLSPSDSLVLGNCTIQPMDNTSFELAETVASTGASKMFGKSVTKKVLFRTFTDGQAEDWIAVLTA